jgi:uncharacterized MAPEG superfamily protein
MSTEIQYLMLTAVLTGCLWIPVVIGYVTSRGLPPAEDYVVAATSPLPHWVNRANRAHLNAVENFSQFAVVVIVGHIMGVSTETTAICAAVYFYSRLAHAVVHISGFKQFKARTILFTISWIAFIVYAITVLKSVF